MSFEWFPKFGVFTRSSAPVEDELTMEEFRKLFEKGLSQSPYAHVNVRETTTGLTAKTFVVDRAVNHTDPDTGEPYAEESGFGIFALVNIAKGQAITQYYGVCHNDDYFRNHPTAPKTHIIRWDQQGYGIDGARVADEITVCDGIVEDATYNRGVACMVNASTSWNCRFTLQSTGVCYLYAIRGITAGEQLFVNYDVNPNEPERVRASDSAEAFAFRLLKIVKYRTPSNSVNGQRYYSCGFVQEHWPPRQAVDGREWRVCYVGSMDMEWFSTTELEPFVIPSDRHKYEAFTKKPMSCNDEYFYNGGHADACCATTFARWIPALAGGSGSANRSDDIHKADKAGGSGSADRSDNTHKAGEAVAHTSDTSDMDIDEKGGGSGAGRASDARGVSMGEIIDLTIPEPPIDLTGDD